MIPVSLSSALSWTVSMFSAAFEALWPIRRTPIERPAWIAVSVQRPRLLVMLTMRPAPALRRSGSIACVTASAPMKLVSSSRRTASSEALPGAPRRYSRQCRHC